MIHSQADNIELRVSVYFWGGEGKLHVGHFHCCLIRHNTGKQLKMSVKNPSCTGNESYYRRGSSLVLKHRIEFTRNLQTGTNMPTKMAFGQCCGLVSILILIIRIFNLKNTIGSIKIILLQKYHRKLVNFHKK